MKLSHYANQQGISYRTALRWWKAALIEGYHSSTATMIVTVSLFGRLTEVASGVNDARPKFLARLSDLVSCIDSFAARLSSRKGIGAVLTWMLKPLPPRTFGIAVIITEESYKSLASFLDRDEIPPYDPERTEEPRFSGRRDGRWLRATGRRLLHADVNGSYTIARTVLPDAFGQGIVAPAECAQRGALPSVV